MSRALLALAMAAGFAATPVQAQQVYRVGNWNGIAGTHSSIQAAVNAAAPGDWILIAPGDYHETGSPNAAVLITTPGLHLRGLDRNGVIVDGTLPGAAPCSSAAADQALTSGGRNGIEALKVDGVSIENLTVCNFLDTGNGKGGNQVWWNGGDGSGVIGMGSYYGAFLTTSSTYIATSAQPLYGVFASNSKGPGVLADSYASNMADSGFYVGACADCNAVLQRVRAYNNAQGFSGTNAGGHLVLEDSEWDQNRVGISHTSLASDDQPSPQNGACPDDPSRRCTIIRRNDIHDNNNASAPGSGLAGQTPTGTGLLLSGGRNDLIENNRVHDNAAWGILINDYPDTSTPNNALWCSGGITPFTPTGDDAQILAPLLSLTGGIIPCYFHAYGSRVVGNHLYHNGWLGNPGNADLANATLSYPVDNCYSGNSAPGGGVSSSPANIQNPAVLGLCGRPYKADVAQQSALFFSLLCDSFFAGAPACSAFNYPTSTQTVLAPIPRLEGMADPCDGVPANPWCPARKTVGQAGAPG